MDNQNNENSNAIPPHEVNANFSQFTYTLYKNGDWENRTILKDGTVYSSQNNTWAGHPVAGNIKHRESVWRDNTWIDNTIKYY